MELWAKGATAQREHCKVIHLQNSSLPPQDTTQRAQVIRFKEITLEECTICEKSAEHNCAHQAERHQEQNAICPWEGMLSTDS